jgi:hypothetical protein
MFNGDRFSALVRNTNILYVSLQNLRGYFDFCKFGLFLEKYEGKPTW